MNYYEKFDQEFIEATLNLDLSNLYSPFLGELKEGAKILDIGCGPGRDLRHFQQKGFCSQGVEPSNKLSSFARDYSGCEVFTGRLGEFTTEIKFDGIWACASLLHIPSIELGAAFTKIQELLNVGGIFYCSFKHGAFEGERNGRFFNDQNLESIEEFIPDNLKLKESWVTEDSRPSHYEHWLNLLYLKE